jgi:hypothetical protein
VQILGLTASPVSQTTLDASYEGLRKLQRNLDARYMVVDERDAELLVSVGLALALACGHVKSHSGVPAAPACHARFAMAESDSTQCAHLNAAGPAADCRAHC